MYPYVCAHEQSKKKNQIKRIILKKLKEIIPGVAGKNIYLQGPDPANPPSPPMHVLKSGEKKN
jgi:hypothetical protein